MAIEARVAGVCGRIVCFCCIAWPTWLFPLCGKDNRGKLKYQNNPKHRSVYVFKYAPTEYGNGKTAAGVGVLASVIIIIFHIGGTLPSLGRAYSIFSV